ncbi:uncharacterized protein EDB91DRAFT_1315939 [Suillus paluster]|uniref:uncharacterized protein n=1 Tax=Suillus paluster TaxID=48578 RepID=UPI001B8750F9|nr:uncharacterized protein EDB91DRAFT_1315939 [Suillus paluster]KAG1727587.1 hypothetical protein EDB91DRAFT_1315939 [Suillus paluster]
MLIHSTEQDITKFPGVIHPRKSILVHIPHTSHLTSSTSSLPASGSSTLHLVTAGDANANILCFDGGGTGTGLCFGRPGDDNAEIMREVQSSIPGSVGGDVVEAGDVDVEWLGEGVLGVIGGVMFVELRAVGVEPVRVLPQLLSIPLLLTLPHSSSHSSFPLPLGTYFVPPALPSSVVSPELFYPLVSLSSVSSSPQSMELGDSACPKHETTHLSVD